MEKVLIIGCSGSGKTTLARQLSERTGLPIIHLDRHFWRDGWEQPAGAEWEGEVRALTAQQRWIMDGTYSGTLPLRLAAADTVIMLDMPRWLCLARVLWRTLIHHGRVRGEELPQGCPERFDWSFLRYIWRYPNDHRKRVLAALSNFTGEIIAFHRTSDVNHYLAAHRSPRT